MPRRYTTGVDTGMSTDRLRFRERSAVGAANAPAAPANPPEIRGTLPLPLTPLIGREALLRRVRETFDRDGPPGVPGW